MKLVHTAKLRQPVRVGLARAAYQTGGPCLDRLDSATEHASPNEGSTPDNHPPALDVQKH